VSNRESNQAAGDRPQRSDRVLAKELGDEVVLYLADGSAVHVLNRTAFAVWTLCDGRHTVESMVEAIRMGFAIPETTDIAADINTTLDVFRQKGLLRQP
jgi:hypothetical protein